MSAHGNRDSVWPQFSVKTTPGRSVPDGLI